MSTLRYVQHLSKHGPRYAVVSCGERAHTWEVLLPAACGTHEHAYLPKSDYHRCDPPETAMTVSLQSHTLAKAVLQACGWTWSEDEAQLAKKIQECIEEFMAELEQEVKP